MPKFSKLPGAADRRKRFGAFPRRRNRRPKPGAEGKILLALLKNSPNLVSKNELFHTLWGTAEFIDENALQVNFTRLRKTLREIGLEERIETVRGQGYRLKEQVGL